MPPINLRHMKTWATTVEDTERRGAVTLLFDPTTRLLTINTPSLHPSGDVEIDVPKIASMTNFLSELLGPKDGQIVRVPVRELNQIAQMAHQAYHTGDGDTKSWRACDKGICQRVRSLLTDAGVLP